MVKPASLIPPKVIFRPPPPGVDGAGLAGSVTLTWAPACLLRLLGRTTWPGTGGKVVMVVVARVDETEGGARGGPPLLACPILSWSAASAGAAEVREEGRYGRRKVS